MSRTFIDSTGNRVTVNAAPALNNLAQRTVMAWIFPTSWGAGNIATAGSKLTAGGLGFGFGFINRSTTSFALSSAYANIDGIGVGTDADSCTTANSVSLNQWTHLAFTYNQSGDRKCHIFLNGVETSYFVQNQKSGPLLDDSSANITVGGDRFGDNYVGNISEFQVYNAILSPQQILLAMGGASPSSENLVLYLPLQGKASPEPDVSGGGRNGTVTGTTQGSNPPAISYGSNVIDSRNPSNNPVFVQGTWMYINPATDSRVSGPVQDCRTAGAPVDSRILPNIPLNSRS